MSWVRIGVLLSLPLLGITIPGCSKDEPHSVKSDAPSVQAKIEEQADITHGLTEPALKTPMHPTTTPSSKASLLLLHDINVLNGPSAPAPELTPGPPPADPPPLLKLKKEPGS